LSVYISRMSVDGRSEVDAPRLQVRSAAAAASVGLVRGVSLRISPHAGSGRGWLGGDHRSSGATAHRRSGQRRPAPRPQQVHRPAVKSGLPLASLISLAQTPSTAFTTEAGMGTKSSSSAILPPFA
jgi:hypothetical protein